MFLPWAFGVDGETCVFLEGPTKPSAQVWGWEPVPSTAGENERGSCPNN